MYRQKFFAQMYKSLHPVLPLKHEYYARWDISTMHQSRKNATKMTTQMWRSCQYHTSSKLQMLRKKSRGSQGWQTDIRGVHRRSLGNFSLSSFRSVLLMGQNCSCQYYLTSNKRKSTWQWRGYQVSVFLWPVCFVKIDTIQTVWANLLFLYISNLRQRNSFD